MVHEFFRRRRSIVMFSHKKVEIEKLMAMFEAARWAPSSRNQQPWRFIFVTKEHEPDYSRMFECLTPGNKIWAQFAPVLAMTIAETTDPERNRKNTYAWHDVGLATTNLIIQAVSTGLFVHPMGGFDALAARKNLSIPESYEPLTVLAIGYHAENSGHFTNELIEREKKERSRKPLNELLFSGKWGKKFDQSKKVFH